MSDRTPEQVVAGVSVLLADTAVSYAQRVTAALRAEGMLRPDPSDTEGVRRFLTQLAEEVGLELAEEGEVKSPDSTESLVTGPTSESDEDSSFVKVRLDGLEERIYQAFGSARYHEHLCTDMARIAARVVRGETQEADRD